MHWALVESYRTVRVPRQHVVAYPGDIDAEGFLWVPEAADKKSGNDQRPLFEPVKPRWVQVDVNGIRVEYPRDFGAPWLGLELLKKLDLVVVNPGSTGAGPVEGDTPKNFVAYEAAPRLGRHGPALICYFRPVGNGLRAE